MAVTLKDVAARAGVSVATASRAFQRPELVAAGSVRRVREAADALGYRPNRSARALITGRTGVYGVIVPDLENPFFPAVLKGAQARAHQLGTQLLITDAGEVPEGELPLVRTLAPQVDGILLCSSRMDEESLRTAAELTPLSLVNRVAEGLPGVAADPEPGIPAALQHLRRIGHRHLGYIGGPAVSRSDAVRRDILRRHCAEAGLVAVEVGSFAPTADGGRAAAEPLLQTDATAVLVYNDLMALGLLERLRGYGVDVPGQLSVVGWDDIPFAAMSAPGLATVQVPRYDMGATAIDLLHARAGGASDAGGEAGGKAQHIALPTRFVPRGSIGRAPGGDANG